MGRGAYFEKDKTYLVYAYRRKGGEAGLEDVSADYVTSACSRTAEIHDKGAQEDVVWLRAPTTGTDEKQDASEE